MQPAPAKITKHVHLLYFTFNQHKMSYPHKTIEFNNREKENLPVEPALLVCQTAPQYSKHFQ